MDLNAEDGGNRKWILAQIPEAVGEDSEAKKAGFNTIADIARGRIRRAGAKIGKGDTGFKSYELAKSNYRQWNVITAKDDVETLKKQMKLFVEKPLVDRYDEKSVVYEILLKEGFDLNARVTQEKIGGLAAWVVADAADAELGRKMVITFAKKITQETPKSLNLSESDIFVCLDNALDDTTKINLARNYNLKVI